MREPQSRSATVFSCGCARKLKLKEERTACINRIRGVLCECGLVFAKSAKVLRAVLVEVIEDANNERIANKWRGI